MNKKDLVEMSTQEYMAYLDTIPYDSYFNDRFLNKPSPSSPDEAPLDIHSPEFLRQT